jgi:hypothetical protein
MKQKYKIGDIFFVPIGDDGQFGYGQVVEIYEKILIYCVFYSSILRDVPNLLSSNIFLAGITARVKIQNGDWKIFGNETRNLIDIKRPNFKVWIDNKMWVVSFCGKRRRKIEEEESDIVTYRNVIAPIVYENALNAHFGVSEWLPSYDKLLYENVIRSQMVQPS